MGRRHLLLHLSDGLRALLRGSRHGPLRENPQRRLPRRGHAAERSRALERSPRRPPRTPGSRRLEAPHGHGPRKRRVAPESQGGLRPTPGPGQVQLRQARRGARTQKGRPQNRRQKSQRRQAASRWCGETETFVVGQERLWVHHLHRRLPRQGRLASHRHENAPREPLLPRCQTQIIDQQGRRSFRVVDRLSSNSNQVIFFVGEAGSIVQQARGLIDRGGDVVFFFECFFRRRDVVIVVLAKEEGRETRREVVVSLS
mmetsp:Transcript_21495/g.66287  ORF Transcript_21495/g.66287 Transcript_21495/m.66287 type:complete len:257 (-) Transcript_21495:65-835(-)